MASHSRIHVRCGTAFLLWVMLVSILVYVVIGKPDDWYLLVLSRVALLLPIAGVAYEVIRLAGRYGTNPFVRAALAPGLWLQRLTTRVPTLDQLEVSIDSLKTVLALEEEHGGTPAGRGHGVIPADLRRQVALGEVALSPDGELVAYTRRTTRRRPRPVCDLAGAVRRWPRPSADGGHGDDRVAAVLARRRARWRSCPTAAARASCT